MSDMTETHLMIQLQVKKTRSLLVNSWCLHPSGEIQSTVCQVGTQHKQSTHRGTSKMQVSGNKRRQNRPERVACTVQLRRGKQKIIFITREEVKRNGPSQNVKPLELPANGFYLMLVHELTSQSPVKTGGVRSGRGYSKSFGFTQLSHFSGCQTLKQGQRMQ